MEKEEIIEELYAQNPWWDGRPVPLPDKIVERELQRKLCGELDKKRVMAVMGLRRVGKTTLLRLMIKHLLSREEPKRVCYFSFDLGKEVEPRRLVKIYLEEILREPTQYLQGRIHFFFDEIQRVEGWGDQGKSIQDKGLDIKFIVSGSSSMNLAKGAGESLAGRITIHRLTPFSFKEFLSYQGIKPPDISLEDISYPANSSRYRIAFKEYMEKGGLPEMYEEFSLEQLRQTLDLVFFRDIVDIFPVKRTDVLKGIFRLTAENTGQKINYTKLAGDLGTEYRTIRDYVEYLQDSFLLEKSVPYERSGLKAMRKNPKMYVSEHAYTNLWRCKKGLVAQTIAFNYLKRYGEPSYIQEPEVDIVLPEKKWAFEVKYSSAVSKGDAKNLASVPKGFRLFMITENSYDTWDIGGRQVQLVPLWLLCLCK